MSAELIFIVWAGVSTLTLFVFGLADRCGWRGHEVSAFFVAALWPAMIPIFLVGMALYTPLWLGGKVREFFS